jgi:hypothetical protein
MVLQGRLWYRAASGVGRRGGSGWHHHGTALQLCLIPAQLHCEPGSGLGGLCETGFVFGFGRSQVVLVYR